MLAPLRSKSISEEDEIRLSIGTTARATTFSFNKERSEHFSSIVRQKKLGPAAIFEGLLVGLEANTAGGFLYAGRFISSATNKEHKLWISREDLILDLNRFNLSRRIFRFVGSPLLVYGAFDPTRGDIVFLDLHE